ncbi:calcineurin-like phosphoesterase family protein [Frondihabitans australicus]|uniref:Calcineurin-like phosphoesterase family protein n=1 Tax=Frondihabitans australicus TaxID=386892 RepID=A0A495IKD6_9MICO|nr:calcineurin-like phosphoesterase family protein [Frondihabitans australicus]
MAGDWHGSIRWIQTLLPRIRRLAPDVKTILQLGDFGYWLAGERPGKGYLAAVDFWAKQAGIERIWVTPGNHEDWGRLSQLFADRPGEPVPITDRTLALPRGYRFTLGGRTFMSFGGAASYDTHHRTEGVDWWPTELATQEETVAAASGPRVEVLLTHETVTSPSPQVVAEMINNRAWAPEDAQARSALSRRRVTQVYDYHQPRLLLHGHMHTPDVMTLPDGRQVWSLGMDRQDRNIGMLDLDTLTFDWLLE